MLEVARLKSGCYLCFVANKAGAMWLSLLDGNNDFNARF
jgi:hypothetical protein